MKELLEKNFLSTVNIRKAQKKDLSFFSQSAEQEGGNPGLEDIETFFATDPNGFFVAEIEGKVVGCISGFAYDNNYSFLGLYIVSPAYRKKGIGKKLWNKALDYLGNRTVGLDGLVEQQESYKKAGFRPLYRNMRYKGEGGGSMPKTLRTIDTIEFDALNSFDTHVFGVSRTNFLKHWIQMKNAKGLVFLGNNDTLQGYGIIRECKDGYKIGPLFAQDPKIAIEIFEGLKSLVPGKPIYIDVPGTNLNALSMVKLYNMEKTFETIRMYNKIILSPNLHLTYGLTSFELG